MALDQPVDAFYPRCNSSAKVEVLINPSLNKPVLIRIEPISHYIRDLIAMLWHIALLEL